MTAREAYFTLEAKRPVFGDTRCIEARDTLRLAAEVRRARKNWDSPDGMDPAKYPDIWDMNEKQLQEELKMWRKVGYGKDRP